MYVGCVQVRPESVENWTPETPTPGVNGQVRSSPALHASMSMLSLAPAARIDGLTGLTASPGSFCLFCEKSESLLPTVTSVEPPGVSGAAVANPWTRTVASAARVAAASLLVRMTLPDGEEIDSARRAERTPFAGRSGWSPFSFHQVSSGNKPDVGFDGSV